MICANKGCTNEVIKVCRGRTRFCCRRCSRANHRRTHPTTRPTPCRQHRHVAQRTCLRCNKSFESFGRSNHICDTCKDKAKDQPGIAPHRMPPKAEPPRANYDKPCDMPLDPQVFEERAEEPDNSDVLNNDGGLDH